MGIILNVLMNIYKCFLKRPLYSLVYLLCPCLVNFKMLFLAMFNVSGPPSSTSSMILKASVVQVSGQDDRVAEEGGEVEIGRLVHLILCDCRQTVEVEFIAVNRFHFGRFWRGLEWDNAIFFT